MSPFYGQRGIIKNIVKDSLFLWDVAFMQRSNGIFVEKCKNVLI